MAFIVTVATGDEGECRGSHEILLTEPSGFISAQLDPTSEVGSNSCPWRIRVRRGQKISVKLFKFGTVITPEDNGISDAAFGANGRSNVCYELATVKEGAHERSLTTCSGEQRENIVYLSDSSMIDIVVLSSGTFLIHYEGKQKLYIHHCVLCTYVPYHQSTRYDLPKMKLSTAMVLAENLLKYAKQSEPPLPRPLVSLSKQRPPPLRNCMTVKHNTIRSTYSNSTAYRLFSEPVL